MCIWWFDDQGKPDLWSFHLRLKSTRVGECLMIRDFGREVTVRAETLAKKRIREGYIAVVAGWAQTPIWVPRWAPQGSSIQGYSIRISQQNQTQFSCVGPVREYSYYFLFPTCMII